MNPLLLETIKNLPPLPSTVEELRNYIDSNGANLEINKIATIISKDPLLVAELLRLANSPFFGFSRQVSTIQQVISLLGINNIKNIVLANSLKSTFHIDVSPYGLNTADFLNNCSKEVDFISNWLKEEDLIDYLALSQCLPGLIALNITIFSGYALRKILGSIVAVFALTLSPFLIILFIAGFIYNFAKYPIVQNAFFGIRLSIIVLIFYMIKDIFTKSVNSKFTVFLFLLILLSNIFLPLGPSSLVVLAILISIFFGLIQDKKERAKLK